jgi:UDP:flavonoid glycosyltransferase YjiC (YdhE family)
VGPLAVDPALAPLEPPAGDAPLVVVTDSTATGVDRSLGAIVLEGLRGQDVRIAVTSAHLTPRRDGPVVVGRGPHLPLLARADVAVGYGGGGFVSKATAAGVPLVVVPLQGDQPEAAARLRDVGVGRTVPPRRANPRRLRRAVLAHLADDGARAAARRLAGEAAQLGPELAARLVEATADGSVPTAEGPGQHLVAGGAGPSG